MIDEDLLESLRAALRRRLRGYDEDGAVRSALQAMARVARERNVRAEHVVMMLKELWRSLPEVQRSRNSLEHARLLERLVTICIDAYYGDGTP